MELWNPGDAVSSGQGGAGRWLQITPEEERELTTIIAKHGDGDVGQLVSHHSDHLARPLDDGLVSAPQTLADLRRWCRHAQDG